MPSAHCHLRYIAVSVLALSVRVCVTMFRTFPLVLVWFQNGMGPKQLMLHAGDAVKNNACLQLELTALYSLLSAVSRRRH